MGTNTSTLSDCEDIKVITQVIEAKDCRVACPPVPTNCDEKAWREAPSASSINGFREFKVTDNPSELRTLISPIPQDRFEFEHGQLRMKFSDKGYTGSASLCWLDSSSEHVFLITCAHNFLLTGVEVLEPTAVCLCQAQNGYSNYVEKLDVVAYRRYPGYDINHQIYNGRDLAIGILKQTYSSPQMRIHSYLSDIEESGAKSGDIICVIGYPGEDKCEGRLYKMEGTIDEIRRVDENHALILYKDLDTSAGQSGSPLYVNRHGVWYLVGVHVGYDSATGRNVATAITNTTRAWMISSATKLSGARILSTNFPL